MSKEDFRKKKEELNRIGIVRVAADFYQTPDSKGFVKSPATPDKTRSLKLYPASNTFCDFANGNQGGDIISFIAYVKGLNNWESMKLLYEFYSLSGTDKRSREERRRMIQKQEQEERKRAERQQAFHDALFALISDLKTREDNYKTMLNKAGIEPFGDLWAYIMNELQLIYYKLDILTGADQHTYRRMKPDVANGLASDRPEWLLDILDILAEAEAFTATAAELSEIKAQQDFELKRTPGADRRCCVTW